MKKSNSRSIALCGIFLAAAMAALIAASFVPGIELSLLAVSTVVGAFAVIEAGPKYGIVFYAAASLLGLIIVPVKTVMIPYIMFFGLYPVVKYFAEKNSKPLIQLLIKSVYFAAVLIIAYFVLFQIFFGSVKLPGSVPTAVILPASVVLFFLLDAILTAVINVYIVRVHSGLRNR